MITDGRVGEKLPHRTRGCHHRAHDDNAKQLYNSKVVRYLAHCAESLPGTAVEDWELVPRMELVCKRSTVGIEKDR